MKKFVVTGGSGFIGSNLIKFLLNKNYFVINIDKLSYSANPYNLEQINKNKELEEKKIEVLVENKLKNQNSFFGRTRKMTPVIFKSTSCNPGDLIQVEIISSNQNNLFGKHMVNKFKAA